MFGFTSDKPTTFLCGLTLTVVMAILAGLTTIDIVMNALNGIWWAVGLDTVYVGLIVAAILMKGNAMMRTVLFYYTCFAVLVGVVFMSILTFGGVAKLQEWCVTAAGDDLADALDCATITKSDFTWMVVIGWILSLVFGYIAVAASWLFIEEAKDEKDSGYAAAQ